MEDKITVNAKKLNKLRHDLGRMHLKIRALERELLDLIVQEENGEKDNS